MKNKYKETDEKCKYVLVLMSLLITLIFGACEKSLDTDAEACEEKTEANESIEVDLSIEDAEINTKTEEDLNPYDFTLTFAGDINFDDNWYTMRHYNRVENGIYDCISPELIQIMKDADIMCLNNEFTYSTGGSPLGKTYTFRAHPSRVNILKELGVDIVTLANNHVYDYGEQALIDTMETLKGADILYCGAGHNLEEAMTPVYFEIDGKKVAYVAASRAEKSKVTPQAAEDSPGILHCYDTGLFIETIKEAKENADYVIAYVHWGTEFTHVLEDVQLVTGKDYLDAGADVVIGAHPHCLQGIEYYNGKYIIYSLGNFWFNGQDIDTMLLNVRFYGDDTEEFMEVEVVPAFQTYNTTKFISSQSEKERIYSLLEDMSINIEIDDIGIVTGVSR